MNIQIIAVVFLVVFLVYLLREDWKQTPLNIAVGIEANGAINYLVARFGLETGLRIWFGGWMIAVPLIAAALIFFGQPMIAIILGVPACGIEWGYVQDNNRRAGK